MKFTSEFFAGNRLRLLEQTSAYLIVLTANGLIQRSADTTYPFRQDSNFWYLSGIEEPDYILVYNGIETFLIMPPRAEHRDLWDGAVDVKALQHTSGVPEILGHHDGWNKLDRLIKKFKKVHTITPVESYFDSLGFYANPARGALLSSLKKHRSLELVDVRKPLARLRQIKQPVEVAALQKAIDITAETLTNVHKNLAKYQIEYELVADITAGFIRSGATGHAYLPIVASGSNASTIHYMKCNDDIKRNELLLFDVGAEFNNYSADISRTYSIAKPSQRQLDIFTAVKHVQEQAYELLKPGVDMRTYEGQVDGIMAIELKKLGLLTDVNDKKRLKKYYPHLASHFLGLDTHDAADYDLPLQPGMVLTVEPGIYIPEENIGVRLEDNVLITATGIKVLSAALPHSLI